MAKEIKQEIKEVEPQKEYRVINVATQTEQRILYGETELTFAEALVLLLNKQDKILSNLEG